MRRLFFFSFVLMVLATNAFAETVELFQHGDPIVNAEYLPPDGYLNNSGWYRITEDSYIDLEGVLDPNIVQIIVTYKARHTIGVNVHWWDDIIRTYALEDPELGWESVLPSGELRFYFTTDSECIYSNFDYEFSTLVSVTGVMRDPVSSRATSSGAVKALYR